MLHLAVEDMDGVVGSFVLAPEDITWSVVTIKGGVTGPAVTL